MPRNPKTEIHIHRPMPMGAARWEGKEGTKGLTITIGDDDRVDITAYNDAIPALGELARAVLKCIDQGGAVKASSPRYPQKCPVCDQLTEVVWTHDGEHLRIVHREGDQDVEHPCWTRWLDAAMEKAEKSL